MGFRSLQACVDALRNDRQATGPLARRQLVVVDHPVDPHLEIAEIQRRLFRAGGPAVLFSKPRGSDFPVLVNLYGTRQRIEQIFADTGKRPRVIIDSQYFVNESSQAINKNIITQRLLVNLNRAARSKMQFINRQNSAMIEQERELKRSGTVDSGTTGLTKAQAGADYRLSGKINSLDSRNVKTGMVQRYTQISFEMTDLESGEIVWSGIYEFSRAAADDVIYR